MSTVAAEAASTRLLRILGLGFSLAIAFGGTVGIGILRLPGEVATALGHPTAIIAAWIAGGAYALLGTVAVSELAAMLPGAGGFYVYTRRAFGEGAGFTIGWSDWIGNTASVAFASITAAEYSGALVPAARGHVLLIALAVLAIFTGLHWIGLRVGSGVQAAASASIGALLIALAVGCFVAPPPAAASALTVSHVAAVPVWSAGMLVAAAGAMRSIVVTYDGWYSSIYLAEETNAPARNVPRAMILCTIGVTALYVLLNVAFLRALPVETLAGSHLPAADAARAVLPAGSEAFVTFVALLTVLSLLNVLLLDTPRILYAIGRDGLFTGRAARVSRGGTPRVALAVTVVAAAALIVTGTFERVVSIAATLFVVNYSSAYLSLFRLRGSEPDAPRPYRAWGYPWTTAIVLAGSLGILATVVAGDPRSSVAALALLCGAAPVYWWIARRRHGDHASTVVSAS